MLLYRLKNTCAYIFLVIFLFVKVADLHVFSHDDDNTTSCELCDFTLILEHTPFINDNPPVIIHKILEFSNFEIVSFYSFIYTGDVSCESLFSRPPPILV